MRYFFALYSEKQQPARVDALSDDVISPLPLIARKQISRVAQQSLSSMYSFLLIAFCLVIVSSAAPQQRLQWQRLIDASREDEGEEDHMIKFPSMEELDEEWQSFKSKYGKTYADASEETNRKEIFANHVRAIIKHNYLHTKGLKSFTMGINEFSDLEHSEFLKKMTCYMYKPFKNLSATSTGSTFLTPEVNFTLPSKVDWRPKGYVTEIKHQGSCGSCWAFSATGSLEGQYFRKSKKLVSLSEQQLVDCSRGFCNHGCNGGDASYAFDYIKSVNGLDTEESYPYEAKDGKCRYKPASRGATCRGHVNIKKNSEVELMAAVAIVGPISVAIDASRRSFKSYKSGVYYTPSCGTTPTKLNHAVLVVGYGTSQEDGDYWIVKNSWGIEWGMEGYIWMSRNRDNQCGIATEALYPLV